MPFSSPTTSSINTLTTSTSATPCYPSIYSSWVCLRGSVNISLMPNIVWTICITFFFCFVSLSFSLWLSFTLTLFYSDTIFPFLFLSFIHSFFFSLTSLYLLIYSPVLTFIFLSCTLLILLSINLSLFHLFSLSYFLYCPTLPLRVVKKKKKTATNKRCYLN